MMKCLILLSSLLLVACNATQQKTVSIDQKDIVRKPPVTQVCGEGEFEINGSRIAFENGKG